MISDDQFTRETTALTPTLYRISMSILRHEADCRDAVQQALLNVWAARGRLEETRFRAYLTRAVINECRNIQRKRMRETPIDEMPDLVDRSSINFTFSPLSYTMDAYLIGGCIHEKKRNCRPVGRGKVRLAEDSKHQDRRGQTRSACKDPTIGC